MTDVADGFRGPAEPELGQNAVGIAIGKGAGQRNLYLHYLRGLAALAVVLYHCSEYLASGRGDSRFLSIFTGFFGGYGVAIFFGISGYLIAEVLRRDSPARFIMSRVARIYPLMLIVIGLFAAVFALAGSPRGVNAISLTLAPSGPRGYFLGVEWTLLYEMTYYVGLGLLGFVGLARYRDKIVVAWLALLCFAYSLGGREEVTGLPVLSEIPLSVITLPFLLGYLASEAGRRGWLHPLLAVCAIPPALAALLAETAHFRLLIGLSAGLLIAGAVCAPPLKLRGLAGSVGVRLGDASYALYLCHVPVILILGSVLSPSLPSSIVWLSWLASALGLALLLGPLDVALYRRLKRVIDTARPARLHAAALIFITAFLAIAIHAEREVRLDAAELEQARRSLNAPVLTEGDGIRADIDNLERLPNGTWVIRGYAIDLGRPGLATHFALKQRGSILVLVGMRRVRPDIARTLERPDLKGKRFGFMTPLPVIDCAAGRLEGFIAVEDGRVVKLPEDRLSTICRK